MERELQNIESEVKSIRDDAREIKITQRAHDEALGRVNVRLDSLEKLVKYGLPVVGILTVVGWFL